MQEETQEQKMRRGTRNAVRRMVQGRSQSLHQLSRSTLMSMLCAGAFAPVVATAEGSGATTVAGIAVLGGVGTNILSGIITNAIDKKLRKPGTPATEPEYQENLESDISEKLATGDIESEKLKQEIGTVLRQVGVGRSLILDVLDLPGERSMDLLLEQLTRLAFEVERFSFIFEDMRIVAEEIREQIAGNSDQENWSDRTAQLEWKRGKLIERMALRQVVAGNNKSEGKLGNSPGFWMVPGVAEHSIPRPARLSSIIDLLSRENTSECRMVSIEGTAGFGKTTLAIQVCQDLGVKSNNPGGILWVTVGRDASDASVAEEISRVHEVITGDPLASADPLAAGAKLGRALDDIGPSLLVIDDAWTADQLAPFLIGGKKCTRLVTTRNVGVAPDGTRTVTVDQMSDEESLQLLLRRIPSPPSALTAQLIRASGRWPILLNLINAALAELVSSGATPAEATAWALARLSHAGPTVFDWDINNQASRDRAVKLTIDASLSLLSEPERVLYLQLSATPRGKQIPISALRLLWANGADGTGRSTEHLRGAFIRLRLLAGCWVEGEPGVYLHDILHDYARHSLSAEDISGAHLKFIENARHLIDYAIDFAKCDAGQSQGADPWWALLDDPLYLWQYLPWHLEQASLSDELRNLLTDLRWVTSKIIRTGSAISAEIDLRLSSDQDVSLLLKALEQSTHVLHAEDSYPSVGATLLSRIAHTRGLESVRDSFRATLGTHLEACTRLPDIPDEAAGQVLTEHTARVNCVSISRDGMSVAAGANDGTIGIWRIAEGERREPALLRQSTARISDVAFSPEGTLLASCSDDESVIIWSLTSGRPEVAAAIRRVKASAIAFSPSSEFLAVGCKDGSLLLYDMRGKLVDGVPGDGNPLICVSYSQTGGSIATGSLNHLVRSYEFNAGSLTVRALGQHEGPVSGVCYKPDGTALHSVGWDRVVRTWPLSSDQPVRQTGPFPDGLSGVTVSSESDCMIASCWNGSIYKITPAENALADEFSGHSGPVTCIAGSPDGTVCVSGGADTTVRIWHISDTAERSHDAKVAGVVDARFNGDGTLVASTADDGALAILNTADGSSSVLYQYTNITFRPRSVDISPDGSMLAQAAIFTEVFDISRGKLDKKFGSGGSPGVQPMSVAFSTDGRLLAEACSDGHISLFDLQNSGYHGSFQYFQAHEGRAWCVRLSGDGKLAVTGGADGLVKLWDIRRKFASGELSGHRGAVRVSKISANSGWIASVDDNGTVRIWSVSSMTLQTTIAIRTAKVIDVAFSPDSSFIASVDSTGLVTVRNNPDGKFVCSLRLMKGLRTIEWSPAGALVCVSGTAGLYLLRYSAD